MVLGHSARMRGALRRQYGVPSWPCEGTTPPTPLPITWNHHVSLATPCPHPHRQSHAFTHVYTGM